MSDNSWKDFAAGTLGGFAGKLLDYPLDTVKTLLQVNSSAAASTTTTTTTTATTDGPIVYRGAFHCLRHTIETNGVQGLYKGISAPLLGSMAENAVLFFMYSHFKRWIALASGGTDPILASKRADQQQQQYDGTTDYNDNDMSLLQLSFAGAGAGFGAAFVLTPFELVKCRLQVQNSLSSGFRAYSGPIDVIVQTVKTEGIIKGLYRGHLSTLLREIPGNFVWYGTYEGMLLYDD
jgi:hypothetical protein